MGASDGINYVIEWYCSNETAASYGAISKVQMNASDGTMHITPGVLAGGYDNSGNYMSNTVNTSTKCIQFYDLTNPSNPSTTINNLNINLEVTDSSFGTLMYVSQVSSGAAINWTFLNSSTVKVRVFSPQFPPYRTSIDLGKEYCGPDANISLKPFNMETIDETGAKEAFSSSAMRMMFMRNNAACNVVSPDESSCTIGDTLNPQTFNPLAAMMSGKTNLMIDLNGGNGTRLYFVNVDMMSSGPPDAILSENASTSVIGSTSMDQIWQFGSFAPDIYDYVLVGIPYDDTVVNEAWTFTTKIPALYDENWNVIWNTTDNGTNAGEISGNYSDYADYPSAWFTGMSCSKTDSTFASDSCYVNTSENKFWLKLPHFSGVGPNLVGSVVTTSTATGSGGATSLSSGLYMDVKKGETLELQEGDRGSFTIKGEEHTIQVTQIAFDHVTFEIRSNPLIVVVKTGETKEIDLDSDGTYDLEITVNNVDMRYKTAQVYIKEIEKLIPKPTGEITKEVEEPGEVEQPPEFEEGFESKPKFIQNFMIALLLFVILIAVLYIVYKKKTK